MRVARLLALGLVILLGAPLMTTTTDAQGNVYDDTTSDVTLIDRYGEIIAGGTSGFGAAVEDQLTTGVPNGLFTQSDTDAQTSDYWTESDVGSVLTLAADTTLPGGYAWRFVATASASASLTSDLIPITDGRAYEFSTRMYYTGANVTWDAILTWYDAAGDALASTSTLALDTNDTGGLVDTWVTYRRRTINPNANAAHYVTVKVQWDWASGSVDSKIDRVTFLPNDASFIDHALPHGLDVMVASDGNITLTPGTILVTPISFPGVLILGAALIRQGSTATARAWEWRLYRQVSDRARTYTAIPGAIATGGSFTPGAVSNELLYMANLPGPEIGPGIYYLIIRNSHATNDLLIRRTATIGIATDIGSTAYTEAGFASLTDTITLSAYSNTAAWPHVALISSY